MKIDLGKCFILSYQHSDKAALVKYADNYKIFSKLKDSFPHPYTEEDAEEWLGLTCNQNPELNFAIANENELIGAIGLQLKDDVDRFSAEIGYWIAEPFWGKGIAASALVAMTDYAFKHFKFNRLFAGVFEGNDASIKVLEKAGYKLEGKLRKAVYKDGNFLDEHIYSILREEHINFG
jgi:RimJ/RimL family protein N-acetyltransferase